jgi:hypothetical protein
MAIELPKHPARCRLRDCHKRFVSVNGAVTCPACMRALAAEFWAAMGVPAPTAPASRP